MDIRLKYGPGHRQLQLPDTVDVTMFEPRAVPVLAQVAEEVARVLAGPLAMPRLADLPAPQRVAIAVPDETRPTPLKVLLPPLLAHLLSAYPELSPRDVTIVVGGGLHPAPDGAQLERILPADLGGCRVATHDARSSPLERLGRTSRGTPVEMNALFASADLKIVVGQIDPHQFVGFTGGAKGAVIGLGSRATIEHNHSLMAHSQARVGRLEDNPVRLDLDEAGEIAGIQLALNVVLNPAKEVVGVVAGRPPVALRQGAALTAQVYGLAYNVPYDLVIASCGGSPKDICLYQAQKGLNMAAQCARPGGRILLLAACDQGIGDETYATYVQCFATPEEQLEEFVAQGFRMGAHKAFLFSRTLVDHEVVVVSELDAATLARCHLTKGQLQPTLDRWLASLPAGGRVAVVPSANTTYFYRAGESIDRPGAIS